MGVTGQDRHGGNIFNAARDSGVPLPRMVDFSASINPLGPSPRSVRAIARAITQLPHYPDPECRGLRQALATRFRLDGAHFLIGNGSTELIHLIPQALSIRRALIIGPTFSEYERAVCQHGGAVQVLYAKRAQQFTPPGLVVLQFLQAMKTNNSVDAVFLCNPNSPTGQGFPVDLLNHLLRTAVARHVWLIVDETFVDYCEDRSLLAHVRSCSRVIVIRSFTKFYALPGLRIGYLAGSIPTVATIRRNQPPWSVNTLGQAAATAALRDSHYAQASRRFVEHERAYLMNQLGGLPGGWTVFPSLSNFLLVELPPQGSATRLTSHLAEQGVLIRDLSAMPGGNKRLIRLAVRTRKENRRLLRGLRQFSLSATHDG